MGMDKAVTFGEQKETQAISIIDATIQTYTFTGEHIISFVIWSPDGDFKFETDADVDTDSFLVPVNVLYSEGLKVDSKITVQRSGVWTGTIYFRGVR